MNNILREDIENFTLPADIVDKIRGAKFCITGATGLIGSSIVRCLAGLDVGIQFILPLRNRKKFDSISAGMALSALVVEDDLKHFFENADFDCDYIIHCASPTNGRYMQEHPVETCLFALESTKAILDYCRRCPVEGMVYLSSIEYYGQIFTNEPVCEDTMGVIDHLAPRSSYAIGKQGAEYLCTSYAYEYGVPAKIARITQTFGAGIAPDDNRVFAQFARSAIDGSDIVMHTQGASAKPYLYTTDCVAALMFILAKGNAGEPYNVATPGSYISVRDLAYLFRDNFAPGINVIIDTSKDCGYAPQTTVNLDPSKILALGWRPRYTIKEMISRLIEFMRE